MRGTKAKALRRRVYGPTDFRDRQFLLTNVETIYRTGGSIEEGFLWGWPVPYSYTVIADPKRLIYQRMKARSAH